MIRYPKPLRKGAIIGVTATSSGITDILSQRRLDNAYLNLKKMSYTCIETDNVRQNQKFVSSSGESRAIQFMNLWKDKKIDIIAQVYGGEFLMEMLPYLDSNILKKYEPKWVTGYSDSSLLNFYLTTNYNIATLTTANIIHFGASNLHRSLLDQIEVLKSDKEITLNNYSLYEKEKLERVKYNESYHLTDKVVYKSLYEEKEIVLKGRLIGGCVEALSTIIGTKYDKTLSFCKQFKEGVVWYLENYASDPLDLYRLLWQMKENGWFYNTNGFIIGRSRGVKEVLDFTYLDCLHKIFDSFQVPVIYDVDIGHVMPTLAFINGSFIEFTYCNGTGKINQKFI